MKKIDSKEVIFGTVVILLSLSLSLGALFCAGYLPPSLDGPTTINATPSR